MRLRYWEVWDHLRVLLNSARMQAILQGGKIYVEGDDYSKPEGPDNAIWGRLIVLPTAAMWVDQVGVGPTLNFPILIRAEAHPNWVIGTRVDKMLDGIQDETYQLLMGHIIPKMTYVMGALPFWQARAPQPLPLWDDQRGLYFTSSEWRAELSAP